MSSDDTVCPECGEPVSATSSYCMHCYADLDDPGSGGSTAGDAGESTPEVDRGDTSPAFGTVETAPESGSGETTPEFDTGEDAREPLLDPDGIADNTLTVAVGIVGGIVVGFVGALFFAGMTRSDPVILLGGGITWLGATVHLARQRTVQEAVARSGYAAAVSLLAFPLTTFGPVAEASGLAERAKLFVATLVVFGGLAAVAAGIGRFAARFVPDGSGGETPGSGDDPW